MIRHVSFRNFKALRHVEVPLERLTAIVGANSSGKTSILQGLQLLCESKDRQPRELFAGDATPLSLLSKGATEDLEIVGSVERCQVRLAISPTQSNGRDWSVEVQTRQDAEGEWLVPKDRVAALACLPSSALVRLSPAWLAEPSSTEQLPPRMHPTGAGLASVLAMMTMTYPDEFQQLQDDLRRVIPTIRRVRVERHRLSNGEHPVPVGTSSPARATIGEAVLFDMVGANSVAAQHAGEGTLLVLGLLTTLHLPPQPSLVLLDDFGHGLHPSAQWSLLDVLRQLMEQRPDLQIVATTHSPFPLDKLRPEEVRLTTLDADGSVACAGMTDHPDFEKWKVQMTPGEFWSVIGEKWVAERNAVEVPT